MRSWTCLRGLEVIWPDEPPATACGGVGPNEAARSGEAERTRGRAAHGFRSRDAQTAPADRFAEIEPAEAVHPWPGRWEPCLCRRRPECLTPAVTRKGSAAPRSTSTRTDIQGTCHSQRRSRRRSVSRHRPRHRGRLCRCLAGSLRRRGGGRGSRPRPRPTPPWASSPRRDRRSDRGGGNTRR